MKLLALDLLAYGPFAEERLDLAAGNAGLHVIFGPNEAGKSSALRALEALLFGIPAQTNDNFRHTYGQLRIGGTLQCTDGSSLSVVRRKGNKATLLTPDNEPLEDRVLESVLAGMDQQRFTRLFGINHHTLQAGGDELLQLGGEVGQSLFAASLGGMSVRARLQALDEEANSLFQPRGQKMTINVLVKSYEEENARMRKASLSGTAWTQQQRQVSRLEEDYRARQAETATLVQQQAKLQRLERILPDLTAWRGALTQLEALGEVHLLPAEFPEDYRKLVETLERAGDAATRAESAIAVLEAQLTNLMVPDALLAEDTLITELHQRLGEYDKARLDQPRLAGQVAQLEIEIRQLVQEFSLPLSLDLLRALHVSSPQRATLRRLSEQAQAIAARRKRAEGDVQKSTREHQRAVADLQELPPAVECQALQDALARARKLGEIEETIRRAEGSGTTARQEAQRALARLTGWAGTLEAAEGLPVPAEATILRFAAEMEKAERAREESRQLVAARQTELAEIMEKRDALQRAGEVPLESDLTEARASRDAQWQRLRRHWIEPQEDDEATDALPLPEAFEHAIAQADLLADRLRREAERVAHLATLLAHQARLESELPHARQTLTACEETCTQLQEAWLQVWQAAQVTPASPEEMRTWLMRFQQVLAAIARMREHEHEAEALHAQLATVRVALGRELTLIGASGVLDDESFSAMLDRAQALVNAHLKAARKREEVEAQLRTSAQALEDAHEDEVSVQQDALRWQADWQAAVAPLRMPGTVSPTDVETFLEKLDALHAQIKTADDLRKRIDGIERDAQIFTRDVAALLEKLALSWEGRTVQQVVAALHAQLLKAREDAATRKGWQEQLAEQRETLRQSLETQQLQALRLQAMCATARCATPDDLPAAIECSNHARELRERIERYEANLYRLGDGHTLAELEAEAADVDADRLRVHLEETKDHLRELTEQIDAMKEQLWEAQAALRTMDGAPQAAEAAENVQSILASLRAPVERYMRLRLTARLLRDAIDQYRAVNQSPMLERAGAIFSQLTRTAFQAVKVDFNENDEQVLKGVRASGEEVDVKGMSDGTRDQLFLALRIASLERYLTENPPMPFIVDDILITFDDERATAALAVLAELSQKTQVIFFTHHQRLVDLALGLQQPDIVFVQELRAVPVG